MTISLIHRIDVRGLEAPEPLERVLDALDKLPEADRLCMLIEREPRPLYRILENNGYTFKTTVLPGYLYEITIWRQAVAAA